MAAFGKSSEIGVITLNKLKELLVEPYHLGDNIILSDKVGDNTRLFMYPFRLDGIVLGVITRGRVIASANLQDFEIGKGMLFIVMPENILQLKEMSEDLEASIVITSLENLSSMSIDVHKIFPLYLQLKSTPFMKLTDSEYSSYLSYFSILKHAIGTESFQQEVISGIGTAFAYFIAGILQREAATSARLESELQISKKDRVFEKFSWLLLQHYERERSVSFYASQLHLTPKHLSKVVKEVSGKTASDWIDEYVILEAKARMKYTGFSIQQVAFSLNFPSATFFSKFFKSKTGITPTEYRDQ